MNGMARVNHFSVKYNYPQSIQQIILSPPPPPPHPPIKQLTSNNIIRSMFQNSYQNGTYFDLLDPKLPADKLKPLLRTTNVNGNNKMFDKDLKTYVLEFLNPTAKLSLPREEKKDLYLIQQYLVLQIFLYPGLPWNLELVLSDLTKTKRRVILSPNGTKTELKPFFVKTPLPGWKENAWNNLSIDLYSYMTAFKGQTFRSLDGIHLSGHFKLRRIYTASGEPLEGEGEGESQEVKQVNFLPKNFYLPQGVTYVTRVNRFDPEETHSNETHSQNGYEPTQPSTKNSSFLKSSKTKPASRLSIGKEPAKTEKIINIKQRQREMEKQEGDAGKKIKDFLSNTNGQLIGRKKKEQEKSESQSSQVILEGVPKTAKSTEKYSKKINLIKTQQMPPKARSSLDKNPSHVPQKTTNPPTKLGPQEKSKTKAKLNPWRTTSKGVASYSDHSQMEVSKQDDRSVDTPQTLSMFKQPPHFAETKGFQRGECSDSEYVQLSQKFSTLTDGKFFKNEARHQERTKPEGPSQGQQQEIEENIEMQSNSIYSSAKRQEGPSPHPIHESICDSLQPYQPTKDRQYSDPALARSSLYGFGEKLMRNFMDEVDRPYSPPLGERQATEQEVSECRREEKEEVELVYDPVLNCYYDHKTHTYYELKN